jgi:peptidoglycan/xylan/chitin deacetylase (PgdA/CDA1 family)
MIKKILNIEPFRSMAGVAGGFYLGQGTALMYHRIQEKKAFAEDFSLNQILSVDTGSFDQQMSYLAKKLKPLSIQEYLNTEPDPRHVLVTFDDGYLDNFTNALPILNKYKIPACFFITTGFVSGSHFPWWLILEKALKKSMLKSVSVDAREFQLETLEEKEVLFSVLVGQFKKESDQEAFLENILSKLGVSRGDLDFEGTFMSWDDLKKFSSHELVTIGAHSVSHPSLSTLNEDEVREEINSSKSTLEKNLSIKINYFAYPYGGKESVSNAVYKASRNLEFGASFTTLEGHIQSKNQAFRQMFPRIMVTSDDNLKSFEYKLSGVYAMLRQRGRFTASK